MEQKPERLIGGLALASAALIIALIGIVFAVSRSRGVSYSVVFGKGKNLKAGDRVQLNGIDIGEVRGVELDRSGEKVTVEIKVHAAHKNKVLADSTAYIANMTFPNVSGQMVVEIYNSPAGGPPMEAGSVIQGKDSPLELKAWQLRGKLSQWGEELEAARRELSRGPEAEAEAPRVVEPSPKDLAERSAPGAGRDTAEVVAKLTRFLRELGRVTADQLDRVLEEWKRLRAEVGPLIERMREAGREVVVERLKKLIEEIERTLQDLMKSRQESPGEGPVQT